MKKKSFILIVTIIFIFYFAYLSIEILQNHNFNHIINQNKYNYIQEKIYLNYIDHYIDTKNQNDILNLDLNDNRFKLNIYSKSLDTNQTQYDIFIESTNNSNIRTYMQKIK
jgi:hypothetical protein